MVGVVAEKYRRMHKLRLKTYGVGRKEGEKGMGDFRLQIEDCGFTDFLLDSDYWLLIPFDLNEFRGAERLNPPASPEGEADGGQAT